MNNRYDPAIETLPTNRSTSGEDYSDNVIERRTLYYFFANVESWMLSIPLTAQEGRKPVLLWIETYR